MSSIFSCMLSSLMSKSPPRPYCQHGWRPELEQLVYLFVNYRPPSLRFKDIMNSLEYFNSQPVFHSANKPFRRHANSRVQQHKDYTITIKPIDDEKFKSLFRPNDIILQLLSNKNQGIQTITMPGSSRSSSRRSGRSSKAGDDVSIDADASLSSSPAVAEDVPKARKLHVSVEADMNPLGLAVIVGEDQIADTSDSYLKWIRIIYPAMSSVDAASVQLELYQPSVQGLTTELRIAFPAVSHGIATDYKSLEIAQEVHHHAANEGNASYVHNYVAWLKAVEDLVSYAKSLGLKTMILQLPKDSTTPSRAPFKVYNQHWQGVTHLDSNFSSTHLKKCLAPISYLTGREIVNWTVGVDDVHITEHRFHASWLIPIHGGEKLKEKKVYQAPSMTPAQYNTKVADMERKLRGMNMN